MFNFILYHDHNNNKGGLFVFVCLFFKQQTKNPVTQEPCSALYFEKIWTASSGLASPLWPILGVLIISLWKL